METNETVKKSKNVILTQYILRVSTNIVQHYLQYSLVFKIKFVL